MSQMDSGHSGNFENNIFVEVQMVYSAIQTRTENMIIQSYDSKYSFVGGQALAFDSVLGSGLFFNMQSMGVKTNFDYKKNVRSLLGHFPLTLS